MNKIRVIDLLNKIANGEEIPEKFKFAGQTFEKQGSYIWDEDGDSIFDSMCTDFSNINDEVEVIEKDKFEYIDQIHNDDDIPQRYNSKIKNTNLTFTDLDRITRYKVNELIDEVNELRKIIYNFKNVEELDIDLYTTEGGIRTAKKINEIIDKINKGE